MKLYFLKTNNTETVINLETICRASVSGSEMILVFNNGNTPSVLDLQQPGVQKLWNRLKNETENHAKPHACVNDE